MKTSNLRTLAVLALSLALAAGACKGKERAATDETTATIAPARPQPAETGTDAMTQTIELGDGRSVSEGAASDEGTAASTSTIDTAAAPMTENPTTTTASTTTR